MSHAFKARRKAERRALDAKDPERRTIRNGIRKGVIPRWTRVQRGRRNYVNRAGKQIEKTYLQVGRLISSFGMIIDAQKLK